jgi:uncharacterized protein YwqG
MSMKIVIVVALVAALVVAVVLLLRLLPTRPLPGVSSQFPVVPSATRVNSGPVSTPSGHDVDAFLESKVDQLKSAHRQVVRIALAPMASDDVHVSKVGGRPYWPVGSTPPKGADGRALYLLAQINFAEMPEVEGYPRQGLLQFYIADDDFYGANMDSDFSVGALSAQRNFRVVYWPDQNAEAMLASLHASKSLPHDPARPRRMQFTLGTETLTTSDYRFDVLFGGDAYAAMETYAQARDIDVDAFVSAVSERFSGAGHKLGGYPYFTQQDPRSAGPMELLFQLDSDDDMMWGDVGVAGFFIAPEDLARADFSRVMYSWDCS